MCKYQSKNYPIFPRSHAPDLAIRAAGATQYAFLPAWSVGTRIGSTLLFCLILLCAALPAQAQTPLDGFLKQLDTLHAEFKQSLYDEKNSLLETSSGVMDLQRPGKFRWEYLQPYRQLIVADGKQIWIYDADLDQVTVKKFDAAVNTTPALLLSSKRDLAELFEVAEVAGMPEHFELIPKDPEAHFQRMVLVLKANQLQQLELEDNLGQTSKIEFSRQKNNTALEAGLFEFTPPPGADLIDGRD
jgi:outer membrane lipoprotein carrier protein